MHFQTLVLCPAFMKSMFSLKNGGEWLEARMIKELFSSWPVIRQIRSGGDGTGVEAMSAQTRNLRPGLRPQTSLAPYAPIVLWDAASSYITRMENWSRLRETQLRLYPVGGFALRVPTASNC
jgi:hypothetical protein